MPEPRKRKARSGRGEVAVDRQRVMASVLGAPWAITPQGLELVLARAQQMLSPEAVSGAPSDPVDRSWMMTKRDGIAQLRMYGPLVSADSWMGWFFPTYEDYARELHTAMHDPSITALVLTMSSPGGHVNGCQEFARLVANARGTKPIKGFVEGDACSAMYWIAAACDEIIAAETSVLGCLGVQVAYMDDSKMLADWGLREIIITSSQTPEKNRPPLDDASKLSWQRMVDDLGEVFLNSVAEYRGVERAVVDAQFGQGAVLVGARAVSAGMADRIGTYESLHAELAQSSGTSGFALSPAHAVAHSQSESPTMKQKPKAPAAAGTSGAATAAAFENDTDVRIKVTRTVGVTEGDEGTIVEVRDGSFYAVRVGEGEDAAYWWLAEDEIEAVSAPEGDAPESEEPAAEPPAAVNAVQRTIASARTAERARITGILAFHTKASMSTLQSLIDDPTCTPEGAAHRLLTGAVAGARSTALAQLAADEAELAAAGGVSSVADGAPVDQENPVVAAIRATNPRALKESARSVRPRGA